jgi:hypothetical protein
MKHIQDPFYVRIFVAHRNFQTECKLFSCEAIKKLNESSKELDGQNSGFYQAYIIISPRYLALNHRVLLYVGSMSQSTSVQ